MPVLARPKQEAYALGLSNGMKQVEAYVSAGYSNGPTVASCASQLANEPHVAARVLELQEERANALIAKEGASGVTSVDGMTREWLVEQLKVNLAKAQKIGKVSEANKAIELMASLMGFTKTAGGMPPLKPAGSQPSAGELPVMNLDALNSVFDAMNAPPAPAPAPSEVEGDDE